MSFNKRINQKLIDNCCHLLARVLAEIVYQSCSSDVRQLYYLKSMLLNFTLSRMNCHSYQHVPYCTRAVVSQDVMPVEHGILETLVRMQYHLVSTDQELR